MASEALRIARLNAKREAAQRAFEREKMLLDRVLTPATVRLLLVAAIIAYATYCARSKQNVGPVQSALAFALPGIGIPLIAAEAGITDKYALAAISATGIGYTGLQSVQGWSEAGVLGDVTMLPGVAIKDVQRFLEELATTSAGTMGSLISAINPLD